MGEGAASEEENDDESADDGQGRDPPLSESISNSVFRVTNTAAMNLATLQSSVRDHKGAVQTLSGIGGGLGRGGGSSGGGSATSGERPGALRSAAVHSVNAASAVVAAAIRIAVRQVHRRRRAARSSTGAYRWGQRRKMRHAQMAMLAVCGILRAASRSRAVPPQEL